MGCMEKVLQEAFSNLPAFLDSIECTLFVDQEYEGKKMIAVCPISKEGILSVKGVIVIEGDKQKFIPSSMIEDTVLKDIEINALTELKIIIDKVRKEREQKSSA